MKALHTATLWLASHLVVVAGGDPVSALRMLDLLSITNGVVIHWQSVSGQTYFLESSTNLAVQSSFFPLATNIMSQGSSTAFNDTNTFNAENRFYRVGVKD